MDKSGNDQLVGIRSGETRVGMRLELPITTTVPEGESMLGEIRLPTEEESEELSRKIALQTREESQRLPIGSGT